MTSSIRLALAAAGLALCVTACGNYGMANEEGTEITSADTTLLFEGETAVIPTAHDGRHSFADAVFGDNESRAMIIDTGSSGSVIDDQVAAELGLTVVGEQEVLSGGVEPMLLEVVRVPSIRIGDLEILNARFVTAPIRHMTRGESFGVIGMDVFSDYLVTFRPAQDEVVVSTGALSEGDPGTYALTGPLGVINIEIDVAGTMRPMHIDTGSPGGFTFPAAISSELPLLRELEEGPPAQLAGGSRQTYLSQLDGTIHLGGVGFVNPELRFLDPSAPSGNIGKGVLDRFAITLDQANRLIRFVPEASQEHAYAQARARPERRMVGLQLGGAGLSDTTMVGGVMPGSLAEASGLQAGDRIISLNGRPFADYQPRELGDLFGGSAPLAFEVEREGENLTIEIH